MNTSEAAFSAAGLLFAVVSYASILFAFRRFHIGLTDIFSLNAIYIAFGTAGVFDFYLASGRSVALTLVGLLVVWVAGMWLGVHTRFAPFNAQARRQLERRSRFYDYAAMVVASLVYLAYVASIAKDGLLLEGGVDLTNRFLLVQDNKVQAYFLGAVTFAPAIILFRINPSLRMMQVALRLLPFGLVQAATLSKTGMISLLVSMLVYYGLQVRFGYRVRPTIRRQVTIAAVAAVVVMLLFWLVLRFLSSLDKSLAEFFITRLMRSFDSLIYLADMRLVGLHDMSLWQWYLAPFLKVAGQFDQYYNGFNYLIAVEYFGFIGDSTPLLPNNTQVGELYVSLPFFAAVWGSLLSGFLYGVLYSKCCAYLAKGGPFLLTAAFVVAAPFGFLVDGQGYFIALLCSLMLSGMAAVISTLIPRSAILARSSPPLVQDGSTPVSL